MLQQTHPDSQQFLSSLQMCFEQTRMDSPLKMIRSRAWERFLELGLPQRKQESFQYVPLNDLYRAHLDIIPQSADRGHGISKAFCAESASIESKGSYLVFVDGIFYPELSSLNALPKQVVVLPLQEAMKTYGNFLNNRFNKIIQEEKDPFTVLNAAFAQESLFLFIPPRMTVETPVEVLHILTENAVFVSPRIQIFISNQSEVQLISNVISLKPQSPSSWVNGVIDISIEEGASLNYLSLSHNLSHGWHFNGCQASLKRNSSFNSISITNGAKSFRESFGISLKGEGAAVSLQGIAMLDEKKHAHAHVIIDHLAPHTQSSQLFKNALSGFSQASFEGKILVRKEAQKTEAYQLNKNLILSEGAAANSKPNLEIFADDVKASHGATVSQLKKEELFYLKSRGLSIKDAEALLVSGFCRDIIEKIPYASIRDELNDFLKTRLATHETSSRL